MGKIIIVKNADFSVNAVAHVDIGVSVNVEVTPNGAGYITGGGSYNDGDTVTLRAVPNFGYEFVQWSDGVLTQSRSIVVGSQDVTYTALFVSVPIKPDVDTNVNTSLAFNDNIFTLNNQIVGMNISDAVTSSQFTGGQQIYKCNVDYVGATYRITLNDHLSNESGQKHIVICDKDDNIMGYVLKEVTGTGERTLSVNMADFVGAKYLYISTYQNNTIGVVALSN